MKLYKTDWHTIVREEKYMVATYKDFNIHVKKEQRKSG